MQEHSRIDLLDVIAFIRVVELGSIGTAATRLGIAKSIVSRRVSRLETVLGAQLLTRTPRGTTPTDIGREYQARAGAGLAELESAQEVVNKLTRDVCGHLRVQVQTAFGEFVLAPLLAEFALCHPRVQFDIIFDDRLADMTSEAYDLSIWVGAVSDQTLITRKLACVDWVVVASPGYLDARGRPTKPSEMTSHDALLHVLDTGQWRFQCREGWETVRMNSDFRTSNGQMLLAAARAGLGMTLIPRFMVKDSLARGELEVVLPAFPNEGAGLHIFMPAARSRVARVRALIDFLYEKMNAAV
ncbi:LysR family transcriptional regulator [Aliidiomarina soli]|uniref:LysR family transcriptional regulator n=1 Tax=Aliidiomarina soli TaxID=1928574 RepID=A0A432WJB5_9GAMM|nr:LysR family transcriptional regulator [Aliidiomarina soli]RUO33797.1 LysR family transcriptional regulator [Aliidiomarina soli]